MKKLILVLVLLAVMTVVVECGYAGWGWPQHGCCGRPCRHESCRCESCICKDCPAKEHVFGWLGWTWKKENLDNDDDW
ncbi:unnamed protein product [Allacma fusca]|uniref:Uncharacterized protein n=1 Tax=Allacma fusca TaxID=39272 RepID=A0A8J2L8Z1_9HEXA|nr:unnamed protein product [Allacma fusca]